MAMARGLWLLLLPAALPAPLATAPLASEECTLIRVEPQVFDIWKAKKSDRPAILAGLTEGWPARQRWSPASAFAELYGDVQGYKRDHDQLELRDHDTTVAGYLAEANPGALDPSLADSRNLSASAAFFVNDYEDHRLLDRLQADYSVPPQLQDIHALRVFALEKSRAGVTFHRHETAWQAQVAGTKAWFLLDPSIQAVPQHSPCAFVDEGPPPNAEHCVLKAGDVIYVPANWWHATCSLSTEPTVAVGAVGSVVGWPEALLAARGGEVEHVLGGKFGQAEEVAAMTLPHGNGSGVFVGGETPLFVAAAFGRAALVDALLAKGAKVDAQRRDGRTALHEATRRGDLPTVERLLEARADPALADQSGSAALHHACAERGREAVVQLLLERGASASAKRGDGRTPVHVACRAHVDPVPILRQLLQNGQAAPSLPDGKGMTPLMHCAAKGNAKGVGLLLRMGGLEAALATDADGVDALGHALAGRGDVGAAERLIAAGLPVQGRMPAAAKSGQTALLAALARHGASPEGAVLEAAQAGHVANLRFLLAEASPRGNVAERREESDGGATPLHVAAFAGHAGAVQALLDFGADALAEDAEGLLASHYAASTHGLVCLRGQTQVLQALAAKGGAAIWGQRGAGRLTPLHLAAAAGDDGLARWLNAKDKVDPALTDKDGLTALNMAEQAGHSGVAASLKQATPPRHQEL